MKFCHAWPTAIQMMFSMECVFSQTIVLWHSFSSVINRRKYFAFISLFKMILLLILLSLQIMQSIGFLGPAFFLSQLSHVRTPAMAVLCMACSQVRAKSTYIPQFEFPLFLNFFEALVPLQHNSICFKFMQNHLNLTIICYFSWQGSDAFSQSGLYSNHQDIGPRYAVSHCSPDLNSQMLNLKVFNTSKQK